MRARELAAGWVVVTFVASAFAQETWMMPSSFSAKAGDEVRFDLSGGTVFPRLENAVPAERVATAGYRLGRDTVALKNPETTGTSLVFRQVFPKDGVATVRLDLKPKGIELTDGDVAAYLDEIDASADIRSTWAGQKGRVPWKETYTKHAKTFVAVGAATPDRSWATGLGAALELVPTTNPFTIQAGHDLTVELQANLKPVSNLRVGLLIEGASNRVFRTTDADGRATFPIAKAGRAILFAVDLRLASDGRSWRSEFCTVTFEAHGAKSHAAIDDFEWTLTEIDGHPLASGAKAPNLTVTGGRAGGFGGCNRSVAVSALDKSGQRPWVRRVMFPFSKGDPMATATKAPARKPSAAFMKPMTPSAALAAVIGPKPVPRTEVTKQLWVYIKKNNLQDPKDKRTIIADAALKAVFGGKASVSMFEMTKLVGKHLS